MSIRNNRGFTLIEVIVVAGIIAILAGILVPLIFKEIDESKISRAQADIKSISSAIFVFRKDVGQYPTKDANCNAGVTLLVGSGNIPGGLADQGFDETSVSSFDEPLATNSGGCYNNWKGPYIAIVSADPWGNAYVLNAKQFDVSGSPVWIISAGPNGTIETNEGATIVAGDDVGLRLK